MHVEFDVVLRQDAQTQQWVASVPSLHGCHTYGESRQQALERIPEAIRLCLRQEQPAPVELARVSI